MSVKSEISRDFPGQVVFDHAIVIGGSIAGLTAARVLAGYFAHVTIIERDQLTKAPEFRRGVPQGRHAHTLPLRGQQILEDQFPGLSEELLSRGAVSINGGSEMAYFIAGGWHQLRHHAAVISMTCSRPLLETTIYRRLAIHPKLHFIHDHEVAGLCVDDQGTRVTGVRLRKRHELSSTETILSASLVVDASGRESHAPQWLASLGYTPPRESTVNAFPGYATRIYRPPTEFSESWKTLYIRPTPPSGTRGGLIIPVENGRWFVTLIGMARDFPPTDEEGFLAFACSLPVPQLYEAISQAEPLTKPYGYRRAENRVRHYDQLARYLEGFLVCGDAAYALNPVYAQGMTAALMGSQALDRCLQAQADRGDLTGLAGKFQQQLSQAVADPWKLATREDRRWPATEVAQDTVPLRFHVPEHRADVMPAQVEL